MSYRADEHNQSRKHKEYDEDWSSRKHYCYMMPCCTQCPVMYNHMYSKFRNPMPQHNERPQMYPYHMYYHNPYYFYPHPYYYHPYHHHHHGKPWWMRENFEDGCDED